MKKMFLIAVFLITPLMNSCTEDNSDTSDCKYGQCQAIAKSTGNQCLHCVSNSGDRFCYEHK